MPGGRGKNSIQPLNERDATVPEIPPDANEADVQEQTQEWSLEAKDDDHKEIGVDEPEADVLDQEKATGLTDEDERER